MKRNSNLTTLSLLSNDATKINQRPYRQNNLSISTNQSSLSLNKKQQYISNFINNNLTQIYDNRTNPSHKNDEHYIKNQQKKNIINNFTQNLKKDKKSYLDNNKERFTDSNVKNKLSNIIINEKEDLINNYNNIIKKDKKRSNHSFLESKYILNKNNNHLMANHNEKISNGNKTSIYLNNENINFSNILLNKNIIIKNIKINSSKNSNKKNGLTNYSSILKSQTVYNPTSPKIPKLYSNTQYQSIENNRNKHKVINISDKNMKKDVKKSPFKQIEHIQIKSELNKNTIINNHQINIINQSKSFSGLDIKKINVRKNNEKIQEKGMNTIELNKPINSEVKYLSLSPTIERRKPFINNNISLTRIYNNDENRKMKQNSEFITISNPNIYSKKGNNNNNFQNYMENSKTIILNKRSGKSNILEKKSVNFRLNKKNEERKSETLKLGKNYYEFSKNFVHSPRFTDYMTINADNKINFYENKTNSNKNIPAINSSIFVKSNINGNNSKQLVVEKYNNSSSISISKINKTILNNGQTSSNQTIVNDRSKNTYILKESKVKKTNVREKTYLITSKKYEFDSKTFKLDKNHQKNKNKSDLINIPTKVFVPKIEKKINNIKSCSFVSISGENEDGFKKLNQDSFIMQRNINGILNFNIFGVLDGHGKDGHYVSQFVSRFIINSIKNNSIIKKCSTAKEIYEKIKINNYKLIEKIFLDADIQIRKEKFDYKNSGTTCIIILHLDQKIICANVGDSRAILVYNKTSNLKDSKIFPLSHDFKPNLPNERKRIFECGGIVEKTVEENDKEDAFYRVYMKGKDFPGLAMSRSIGDIDSKKIGIIPNPEFIEYNISEETKYIILGSDGIWEFMSNEEVMKIANEYYLNNDAKGLCKCLYETSAIYWNDADCFLDDITAIAIFF